MLTRIGLYCVRAFHYTTSILFFRSGMVEQKNKKKRERAQTSPAAWKLEARMINR